MFWPLSPENDKLAPLEDSRQNNHLVEFFVT
jgi:hypothetical protein